MHLITRDMSYNKTTIAHILSLQDVILRSIFFLYFMTFSSGNGYFYKELYHRDATFVLKHWEKKSNFANVMHASENGICEKAVYQQ